MTERVRIGEEHRRHVIITAAVRVALSDGLPSVTHGSVAARCAIPTKARTVRHYYKTQHDLWLMVLGATDDADVHRVAGEMGVVGS